MKINKREITRGVQAHMGAKPDSMQKGDWGASPNSPKPNVVHACFRRGYHMENGGFR